MRVKAQLLKDYLFAYFIIKSFKFHCYTKFLLILCFKVLSFVLYRTVIFFVGLSTFKTFCVVEVLIFVKFSHLKFAYSFYVLMIILYCQMWLKKSNSKCISIFLRNLTEETS